MAEFNLWPLLQEERESIRAFYDRAIAKIPFLLGIRYEKLGDQVFSVTFDCLYDYHRAQVLTIPTSQDAYVLELLVEDIGKDIQCAIGEILAKDWQVLRSQGGWLMICTWNGYEKRFPCPFLEPPLSWRECWTDRLEVPSWVSPTQPLPNPIRHMHTIDLWRREINPDTKIAWYR